MARTLLIVLGMHRSGTSAVARLVNLLGAELGGPLLEARPGINEEGFWEHREVVRINEAVLNMLDSAWYDHRPYPEDWWREAHFAARIDDIRALFERDFANNTLVAIKDPRLCRTLPLWRRGLEPLGWRFAVLLVLRDPVEVVASLARRDDLPELINTCLWLVNVDEAQRYSRDLPRVILDYAEVLNDWRAVAKRASEQFALTWPGIDNTDAIDAAIRPGLRHQYREGLSALPQNPAAELAEALWCHLMSAPGDDDDLVAIRQRVIAFYAGCKSAHDTLFLLNRKVLQAREQLSALGEQHDHAIRVVEQRDAELQGLGEQLAHARDVVEQRDRQLVQVQDQLQALGLQHSHALHVIEQRDRELLDTSERAVRAEAALTAIYSHWSWRLLRRLRIV